MAVDGAVHTTSPTLAARLAAGGLPVYVVYAQTASATPPLKSRVFVELVKDVMAREVLAPLGRRR